MADEDYYSRVAKDLNLGGDIAVNPFPTAKLTPESAAEGLRVGRKTGLSPDLAANNIPQMRAIEDSGRWEGLNRNSPALAKWMASSTINASVAKDDTDVLSYIEGALKKPIDFFARSKSIKQIQDALDAPNRAADARAMSSRVAAADPQGKALRQFIDPVSSFMPKRVDYIGELRPQKPTLSNIVSGLWREGVENNIAAAKQGSRIGFADAIGSESMRDDALKRFGQAKFENTVLRPELTGEGKGWYEAGVSAATNATTMTAALLTKSPTVGLTAMGATMFPQVYGETTQRGGSAKESFANAGIQTAIEVFGESVGMGYVVKKLGKAGASEFIKGYLGRELPTELLQEFSQNAVDTAIANPDKTWGDYINEAPDTLKAVLRGTILMSGGLHVAHTAISKVAEPMIQAREAEARAVAVEEIKKTVQASKLLSRDNVTFHQLVEKMSEDGPITTVQVDARRIQEAGGADQMADISMKLGQSFTQALETGGEVTIPVADYLTYIANTPLDASIADHVRYGQDTMTRAEAKETIKSQGEALATQLQKTMERHSLGADWKASHDVVHADIESQLNALNRAAPEANKLNASIAAAGYASRAAVSSMTPEEYYKANGLKVSSNLSSGDVLGQSGASIKDVSARLEAENPGAKVDVFESANGDISLSRIQLPTDDQNQGRGSEMMRQITAYADEQGKRIVLSPSADFGGNKKRLVAFYKQHGFVENKGKNKDFAVSETMIREPSNKLAQSASDFFRAQGIEDNSITPEQIQDVRDRFAWTTTGEQNGFPTWSNEFVSLQNPRDITDIVDVFYTALNGEKVAKYDIQDPQGNVVGYVAMEMLDTWPTRIIDIETQENERGKGYAENTITSILADVGELGVWTIVPSARSWWERIGTVPTDETNGTITLDASANARASRPIARADSGTLKQSSKSGVQPFDEFVQNYINNQPLDTYQHKLDIKNAEQEISDGWMSSEHSDIGGSRPDFMGQVQETNPEWFDSDGDPNQEAWGKANELEQEAIIQAALDYVGEPKRKEIDLTNPRDIAPMLVEFLSLHGVNAVADGASGKSRSTYITIRTKDKDGKLTLHSARVGDHALPVEYAQADHELSLYDTSEVNVRSDGRDESDSIGSDEALARTEKFAEEMIAKYAEKSTLKQSAQIDSEAFKRWFGDSKVVDAEGKPLVVYHGTAKDFDAFDNAKTGANDDGLWGRGHYFASSIESANSYALRQGDGARVIPAYVSIQNPLMLRTGSDLVTRLPDGTNTRDLIGLNLDGSKIKSIALDGGHDGVIQIKPDGSIGDVVAFSPEQIKSAIGNNGEFDGANPSILNQEYRAEYAPSSATITLLKDADSSSFLHELGHHFLELDTRLNNKILEGAKTFGYDTLTPVEKRFLKDQEVMFNWLGLQGSLEDMVSQWNSLSFEDKRPYHEQFARGFEAYLFEGKAPSIELASVFARVREWFKSVYSSLKELNVELTPEVRGVFDRMLASEEQIDLANQARGMFPMFETAEQAGWTEDEFAAYQAINNDQKQKALDDLESRGLRDMRLLTGARGRELKRLQKEAKALRDEATIDARREVMSQPIYQAWQFLKGKIKEEDKFNLTPEEKMDKETVYPSTDSLFVAIAKLGGIQFDSAKNLLGLTPNDKPDSGIRGMSVIKTKKGNGLSANAMHEKLSELGYTSPDTEVESFQEFIDKFHEELGGNAQYSIEYDYKGEYRRGDEADLNVITSGRLDRRDLVQMYGKGEQVWSHLDNLGMVAKEGFHPDVLADQFGFSSGDELVRMLAAAQSPKLAIEARADEIMFDRHADLASDQAIEEAADRAIHNAARGRAVLTEHNAMAKMIGSPKILMEAAKAAAQFMVGRLKLRDLHPTPFITAAARAGKAARSFSGKGDMESAVVEKRNEVLNTMAAKEAYKAQDEVEKILRYLRRLDTDPKLGKRLGADDAEQIKFMLSKYDLSSTPLKHIDSAKSYTAWVVDKLQSGYEPPIPIEMLNTQERADFERASEGMEGDERLRLLANYVERAEAKSYKDMTLGEFRGLNDLVKQMEYSAKKKYEMMMAIRDMDFKTEVVAITDQIRKTYPKAFNEDGSVKEFEPDFIPSFLKKAKNVGDKAVGFFIDPENLLSIMDGGKHGQLSESLFDRMSDRSEWKKTTLSNIYKTLKPLYDQYGIMEKRDFATKDIGGDIGMSLSRENALVVALLNGNEEGRDRLANYGWDERKIASIIDLLDERDMKLADGIWKLFDETLWPQLESLNKRTRGASPPKVVAVPFMTKHGVARGGYMRIKYDTVLSQKASENEMLDGMKALSSGSLGMSAKTSQGSSIERKQGVKMRPRLDLKVFSEAVNETVHDLAYRESAGDTMRLLQNNDVSLAIKQAVGIPAYQSLLDRLISVATVPRDVGDMYENAFRLARKNVTVAMLSGMKTALLNYTGIVPAMYKVNPLQLTKELALFHSPLMLKQVRFVTELSEYMRNRYSSFDRDLVAQGRQLTVQNRLMPDMGAFLFLMSGIDRAVSVPVWKAAYYEGMKQFDNDSEKAVHHADQVVRSTQGSGRDVDLGKLMSTDGKHGQAWALFTMFHSYMHGQLNLLYQVGAVAKQEFRDTPVAASAKFAAGFILVYIIPAVIQELQAGGGGDDDDLAKRAAHAMLMYGAGMAPIARDMGPLAWSKIDSSYPNFGFRMSPVASAAETLANTPGAFLDIVNGENDLKDDKTAIMGLSLLFGGPGKLISDVTLGTQAWINDEAGPQAIVLGPPSKKR